jgi:glycosyltransferase involved in cell wall biosynthesis
MKFSVLMSVYKNEKAEYLRESLQSLLNQSIMPQEIVIVQDGPIGLGLLSVIREYKNENSELIKTVILEENRGLGYALQEGILQCKEEWIARMDTDDVAVPDRFEKQTAYIESHPGVQMIGGWIYEFDDIPENIIALRKTPLNQRRIYRSAKFRNPFNHMTVMYRKAAVLNAGNYQHSTNNEDYHLWARMIMQGVEMYNLPEVLVYARAGKDLFSRRGGLAYIVTEYRLQKYFLHLGFISIFSAGMNLLLRSVVRILPNAMRRSVYLRLLHSPPGNKEKV